MVGDDFQRNNQHRIKAKMQAVLQERETSWGLVCKELKQIYLGFF